MRVLLDVSAVPAEPVGVGVYTWNLAEQLSKRIELSLYARKKDAARWSEFDAEVIATAPSARPARLFNEQLAASRIARNTGAQVWHGPHYTLPLRLNTPRVVTIHDLTLLDHPEWHERSKVIFFRRMIPAAIRRANAIICDSEFTAESVQERFEPRVPVFTVHLGVNTEHFSATKTANDKKLLQSLGARDPYIMFAGTFEPRKNIPALIQAFANIRKRHKDLQLVLAGNEGWGANAVHQAITQSGVATHILRPGYVTDEELVALYRNSKAVCYPSLAEGFGLPALEALACGAPLVSTTGSAIEEFVDNAAMLVSPNDIDALSDALDQVCSDTSLAEKLRKIGPQRAQEFSWERSASEHIKAYEAAMR